MPLGSIEALLTRHGLPSGALMIELADSDPRIPLDELERRLAALRRLGVRIALDGFGSGYAAINALRRLPVDVLKLDRGLVEGVVESARLHKITSRAAADRQRPRLQSVADGVDLPEQVIALRAMGCTHGQGMAFSGPLDEYRLRRALCVGRYPVPHGPVDAGLGRAARSGVCGRQVADPCGTAHIMRRPSHRLDSARAPGRGSMPCAPEFSYLESASAEAGLTSDTGPCDRTRRAPLACLTARGVFCCTGTRQTTANTPQKPSASRRECR